MLQFRLSRKAYFSSAHKYELKEWSPAQNKDFFGSCYSEHGHGHNYVLEAVVEGPLDPSTGMIINLADLDALLKNIVLPLDHAFLNDTPLFQSKVPTTENIAEYCFTRLNGMLIEKHKGLRLVKVIVNENEDLFAEVEA